MGSSSTGSSRDAGSVPPVPAGHGVTDACDVRCVHMCLCGSVARQDLTPPLSPADETCVNVPCRRHARLSILPAVSPESPYPPGGRSFQNPLRQGLSC